MLIVVKGFVGVGKSTVAKGLAGHRGSDLLLENFEANPFRDAFYAQPIMHIPAKTRLRPSLHFFYSISIQLKTRADQAGHGEVITDFHLWKDPSI